jgi:hypothetical protein
VPRILLSLLLAAWVGLGLWICRAAPFGSGTDESMGYLAFVAAKDRWPSVEEARRHRVEHFYYAPLYFLFFAPWYGDEPSFTESYPRPDPGEAGYADTGSLMLVSESFLRKVPPALERLYRRAKVFSLALGVAVAVFTAGTIRTLYPGSAGRWLALGGTGALLLLPQFLYYQTLVNNDALVNALGAAAVFLAVRALRALEAGRTRSFVLLGLGTACAVGLGLLNKLSAVALAPALVALAAAPLLPRGGTAAWRPGRVLAWAAGLAVTAFLAGGWWLLRDQLVHGDWSGSVAHLQAHPWAGVAADAPAAPLLFLFTFILRSYIALFSGALIGIPDSVFVLYLAAAATFAGAAAVAWSRRRSRRSGRGAPRRHRRLAWALLLALPLWNYALVLAQNTRAFAPYGRLMFPTLAAQAALVAGGIRVIAGSSRRRRAAVPLALLAVLGALFAWVFLYRMAPAVAQRPESVVPLTRPARDARFIGPVWNVAVEQPFTLPRGTLRALRVNVMRPWKLPQLGCVVTADLYLAGAGGLRATRLAPVPLESGDAAERWLEFPLPGPLLLAADTPAVLRLQATRPWIFGDVAKAVYVLGEPGSGTGVGPSRVNGSPSEIALMVSAVYAR